jgi:hypothetical protein
MRYCVLDFELIILKKYVNTSYHVLNLCHILKLYLNRTGKTKFIKIYLIS